MGNIPLSKEIQMIVTVAHTKGGVGKSTLAFSLAIARGGKVWLIDGDRQALETLFRLLDAPEASNVVQLKTA